MNTPIDNVYPDYFAAGLLIRINKSGRASWLRLMRDSLRNQCECMEVKFSALGAPDVLLCDFEGLKNIPVSEVVGSKYSLRDGIYVDHSKRIGIRFVSANRLEYWHDLSYELSIPFLIQLVLLQRGQTFVHSAGVTVNGKACVFPAFGGIGKTLIVSHLLRHPQVKLLGDDLVVLHQDGSATSYARPFCFYEYHRSAFVEIFKSIGLRYLKPNLLWRIFRRIELEMRIRYNFRLPRLPRYTGIAGDYILVSPNTIFGADKVETSVARIEKVILVKKNISLQEIRVKKGIDFKEVAQFASSVTMHEWNTYARALMAFGGFSDLTVKDYFRMTYEVTERAFSGAREVYLIELPGKFDMETYFREVENLILN
jgi:hypothetical protein